MKKMTTVHLLVIIIGALSMISGIYLAATGGEFNSYFSGIFLGITLVGTAYFLHKKRIEEGNSDS